MSDLKERIKNLLYARVPLDDKIDLILSLTVTRTCPECEGKGEIPINLEGVMYDIHTTKSCSCKGTKIQTQTIGEIIKEWKEKS